MLSLGGSDGIGAGCAGAAVAPLFTAKTRTGRRMFLSERSPRSAKVS
jgi:hypothetical protein